MKITKTTTVKSIAKTYKCIDDYINEENGLYILDNTTPGWDHYNSNNNIVLVSGYDGSSRRATLLSKLDVQWSGCSRLPMRKATPEEVFQISND